MQTRAQKRLDLENVLCLYYTFLIMVFFFFFYNQHIFIGKWKKQKITEKKWKGNIFEGRGDQNSGVGYPASPSLHKDQWLDSCP